MSSTSSTLHYFLVYAPDKTDEGAFDRRMSVRERHLEGWKDLAAEGFSKFGGAMLSPGSITGGERKLIGSTMVVQAASIEEVKQKMEKDIYWTAGVWDLEKMVIVPFLPSKPL
ncbi:hypothetical protein SISNIDRAFT_418929 [Sistotremastrum niveocremeum HHB9708]|uniref:YCII-related domain-containing protein n=2 Tax=Sistotremastraceae TaxID=3402574 RepID=A0A164NQI6_9AGAM|nr:hypothetical protein SISNIDRAFT_418929 [Sistotremastrum niveocremeum HHB9708]KZT38457.1 hypothetical protein SISSUDRAFT_1061995 [Sistotremastrum suecicum HHB10207 ss-3]